MIIKENISEKVTNEDIKNSKFAIPDSVTEIGSSAFDSCTSLKKITIPDSVMEIGSLAFRNCTSLKAITIPDSVMEANINN